jgi:putative ATPase
LRALIEQDRVGSLVLWGPPGTGKTSLAELIAEATSRRFVRLSAVTSGVSDVRSALEDARRALGETGRSTVLFIDEIHRFSSSQQDALLPSVESGLVTLIGATTDNPHWGLTPALRSRVTLVELSPLGPEALRSLLDRATRLLGIDFDPDAAAGCVAAAAGDARRVLTVAETAAAVARFAGHDTIRIEDLEAVGATGLVVLDSAEHFALVSALIKSMRAGHADAALHWLARLLQAGEPPHYVGRRLTIFAAEDIGEADPSALVLAGTCARAAAEIGMPEAALVLGQACVHLALAPKSRAVADAVHESTRDVEAGHGGPVPRGLAPGGAGLDPGDSHWPVGMAPVRYYRGEP